MSRREPPKVIRQQVFWVPDSREIVLPDGEEPYRVWTLYGLGQQPDVKPELPISPVHNHGAFLEDYMHDWNIRRKAGGFVLNYYSRVVKHSVWILCEYVDRPRNRV